MSVDVSRRAKHFQIIRECLSFLTDPTDRTLFKRLARNKPGPGASATSPAGNRRFVEIQRDLDAADYERAVKNRVHPGGSNRETLFRAAVGLVHRVAKGGWSVYVGRTYHEPDGHKGLSTRWTEKAGGAFKHKHGCVIALVPMNRILRDELLGQVLVYFWSRVKNRSGRPALCCYNKVLGANGRVSRDHPKQIVYLCLRRKTWKDSHRVVQANNRRMKGLISKTRKLMRGESSRGARGTPRTIKTLRVQGKKGDRRCRVCKQAIRQKRGRGAPRLVHKRCK